MNEHPTAADIMAEVRQGLSDTALSETTRENLENNTSLQVNLRQTHEHASVLGRCKGSLRGKCCSAFAPLAKPIIEQLDRFHNATVRVLEQIAGTQKHTQSRLHALELRLQELESKEPSTRQT